MGSVLTLQGGDGVAALGKGGGLAGGDGAGDLVGFLLAGAAGLTDACLGAPLSGLGDVGAFVGEQGQIGGVCFFLENNLVASGEGTGVEGAGCGFVMLQAHG